MFSEDKEDNDCKKASEFGPQEDLSGSQIGEDQGIHSLLGNRDTEHMHMHMYTHAHIKPYTTYLYIIYMVSLEGYKKN